MPRRCVWRNRVQSYDSTFTLSRTDGITLHYNSGRQVPEPAGRADLQRPETYYDMENPYGSVILPKTGTKITIDGDQLEGPLSCRSP